MDRVPDVVPDEVLDEGRTLGFTVNKQEQEYIAEAYARGIRGLAAMEYAANKIAAKEVS